MAERHRERTHSVRLGESQEGETEADRLSKLVFALVLFGFSP